MSFWSSRPIAFQSFISVLSFCFVLIGTFYFIKQAATISDENIFTAPPTEIYITDISDNLANENKKDFYNNVMIGSFVSDIDSIGLDTLDSRYEIFKSYRLLSRNINIELKNYKKEFIRDIKIPAGDLNYLNTERLSSAAIITYVIPEGVSDRAGLKNGDIITRINGKTFESVKEADEMIRNSKPGSTLEYQILREGERLTKKVTLPKFGINFSQLLLMLCGITLIFIGELLGIKRPRLKGARITAISLILFGLVMVLGIVRVPSIDGVFGHAMLYLAMIALYFSLPAILHSFKYFPRLIPAYTENKWVITLPYIMATIFFALQMLSIYGIIADITSIEVNLFINNWGFLIFIFSILIISLLSYILYKNKLNKSDIKKSRLVKYSYVITFMVILSQAVLFQFEYFKLRELIYFSMLLIPISYVVTISKYKVFDLSIRVKRNYLYLIVSGILYLGFTAAVIASIYLLTLIEWQIPNLHFTGTSIEVLKSPLRAELHDIYEKIIVVLLSIIIAIIFWNLAKMIQEKIDMKFYRSKFDFRQAARQFSKVNTKNFEPKQFSGYFLDRLLQLIKLKRAGLLLFKDDKLINQTFIGFNDETLREYCSAVSNKLIKSVKNYSESIPIDYLPDDLRIILKEFQFRHLTPIWSKKELIGIIFIGEKLSETSFQNDDLIFLSAIAGQASIAIENSLLYEDLAKQERYKHELEIARKIQLASLPDKTPQIQGVDVAGVSLPALEVGGDFYDILNGKSDILTIIVGDVSGKGTSAALYMSKIQGIIRTLYDFDLTPKELLMRTNQLIFEGIDKKSFITAVSTNIEISINKALIARAGHLPVYHYVAAEDKVNKIQPDGIMIGLDSGKKFDKFLGEIEVDFNEGDIFIFATDGIIEARNENGKEFSDTTILDIMKRYKDSSAEELKEIIMERVKRFMGSNEQFDDITLVIVKKSDVKKNSE